MKVAKVVVDVPAAQTNKIYDYTIPMHLHDAIEIGMRVIVPFGNRKIMGYVLELTDTSAVERIKDIDSAMDMTPILTVELLELGKWLAEHTMSFYISAFQAMLPQALKANYVKYLHRLSEDQLDERLEALFAGRDYLDYKEAVERDVPLHRLKLAIQAGDVEISYQVNSKETIKKIAMIKLAADEEVIDAYLVDLGKRAKKKREIINYFQANNAPIPLKDLLNQLHTTRQTVKALENDGLLVTFKEEVYRNPYQHRKIIEATAPLPLRPQQSEALGAIVNQLHQKQAGVFLLHGVTGSGKTEVYLQAIGHALELNKEAIVLVPEIALTPQMVERFKGRFGSEVAVLHSALSKGERFDEWRKIQRKEVRVVVGARSAIFAPFDNIGIIIIDEEHESSYKQEDHPRYHVKDVAIKRAENHQCPIILGSATPTMESYARAKKGLYHLLEMPDRMSKNAMPTVHLADMREELHAGNRTMFSRQLQEAISDRLEQNQQIVLFLNRRGYSTFVSCRDCGHVVQCPNCDISLTYHRKHETLKCHYCNYQERMPQQCPKCTSDTIRYFGTGTQKVEEALYQTFPEARVIRMDVDTTRKKGAHERLLAQFGNKQADILLGTQMIAKGLDFPDVTLVGVLAADSLLNLPDFRAAEKTFQLLTQVSGRAGRHLLAGEVVVQTYTPDHYSIQYAAEYNYHGFFEQEMALRRAFQYPPYFYMTLITVLHPNPLKAEEVTRMICKLLQKHLSQDARILGPSPSPIERIKNRYRYQCIIKYKHEPKQHTVLTKVLNYYEDMMRKDDLLIQIDLQPYQLM